MNKIRILSDNLANQIAAGEVVERPASVVKEMIENSIDANATRIDLEVELGGRRLIKVSDDGEGMTRDDAILAFERHATSKIRTQEDLAAIGTLGFRGEALASIASVARIELITKNEADEFATKVIIEGGRLLDVGDAGRDRGTTIVVRDLFFNTPARRKFMRSEATENYHLTSIVTHYSLAHPGIAFSLKNNGREVIRAVPAKDVRERAFQLFGSGLVESLLPVRGSRDFVAGVTGFVSAPRERRTNRDNQFFFVNKRFVRDKILARGLEEGFRSVLPHGVYPVAFLFLEIPLDEVDVNVHPAKTEVRFRRGEAVKDVVAEAVREALLSAGITGDIVEVFKAKSDPLLPSRVESTAGSEPEQAGIDFHYDTAAQSEPERARSVGTGTSAPVNFDAARISEQLLDAGATIDAARELTYDSLPVTPAREEEPDLPPVNSAQRFVTQADVEQMSTAKIRPLGQLHDSFIIAVDDEGLL
nr:DNA mismatch repair endonuclease MutL [Blastocatellia bacterium]